MHYEVKNYSAEFTRECKTEFGLPPEKIKEIVITLSANNSLDVTKLLMDAGKLKNTPRKIEAFS